MKAVVETNSANVIKRGRANVQTRRDSFMYGAGTLELSASSLHFVPNWTNLGLAREIGIPLEDIEAVMPVRPRLYGLIPSFLDNGLLILGKDGRFEYVISVSRRSEWAEAIENARGRRSA
jgi:hypothetical protein